TKQRPRHVPPIRARTEGELRRGSIVDFVQGDECRNRSRSELCSQLQIDHAIGSDDAVLVFHIFAWPQVDPATGSFNQNPSCRDVPQTDSAFDISVKASA